MIKDYCPTTCDADATHTCFFDASGCSVNASAPQREALGCGAGGLASCRYCGFEDYPRCPSAEQPLLQAQALSAIEAQIRLPQDTGSETPALTQASPTRVSCAPTQASPTRVACAPTQVSPTRAACAPTQVSPTRVSCAPTQASVVHKSEYVLSSADEGLFEASNVATLETSMKELLCTGADAH